MRKNSFVLQTRLNAIVTKLSERQAGILFKSILNYAENGIKANFEDGMVDVVFEMVKQDIDYTSNKYAEICKRNAENGKLGGRPKNPNKPSGFLKNPKKANGFFEKHNDVDNDVDVDNELLDKSNNNNPPNISPLKEGKRFQKPTVEEIKAYCTERNNNIDAQGFFDFYESKGWKVGNTPMKDWRAAIRNWERKNKSKEATTQLSAPVNDILEFMLAHYEKKGISENPTLKARYVKQWANTANDLVNACGGNIELAKTMIKLYESKQTGEWYLWGVLNDFCGLYEELKRKNYVK